MEQNKQKMDVGLPQKSLVLTEIWRDGRDMSEVAMAVIYI